MPDTASFRLVHQVGAAPDEFVNTIYVRNTVLGWPAARLTSVGTTIGNAWRDQVMPLLPGPRTLFDRVEATDEGDEFGAQATIQYNTLGGSAGTPASDALAAVAKLVGASGGAPRQGRLFIGPLTMDRFEATDPDNLTAAFIALLEGRLDAVDAAITGGGDTWVIVSRYSKTVNPVAPHKRALGLTNQVADRVVRQLVGTQRDRRTGIGS